MVNKKIVKVTKEKKLLVGVVDDNAQIAISISEMLRFNGFRTFEAYEASDAIRIAKKEKPSLLLVDIKLGGITGYDVARELPEQKILFITGFDVDEDNIKKFKNAIGVMQKPLDMKALANRIKKALKIS